jgi:transcriptional regulator with XRE-family HTH domain
LLTDILLTNNFFLYLHSMNSIFEIRKTLGLSQRKMADVLGITSSQLAMYETGKRGLPPKAKLLVLAIASYLEKESRTIENDSQVALGKKEKTLWEKERKNARRQKEKLSIEIEGLDEKENQLKKLLACKGLLSKPEIWASSEFGYSHWELLLRKAEKAKQKLDENRRTLVLKENELNARIALLNIWLGIEPGPG